MTLSTAPILLLLGGLGSAAASDSSVFPLLFNPLEVSHWKCLGYTVYENTAASASYTYEVDVCFMAALALKLTFPWWYQHFTGTRRKLGDWASEHVLGRVSLGG